MATVEKQVDIINKLGLHARAATKLAQLSMKFNATITLELEGNQANATSIMAIMLLAGAKGKSVKIIADGADAEQALQSVCQLIVNKFGESE
jgi:phosphotransferase system HPr (HPr) family protein|tara:strand:+ start:739 stop:1014 length:276 start_codon:yes stop_codon:yes gene_type:complete